MVEILRSLPRFSIAESDGCFIPKVSASSFEKFRVLHE
ncbi:hypothetical protein ABEDC_3496 (plasmid) [Acinetobacter lwoffii]|nr:hypothetical protein ABEDC_3496 [Acinetobacter lwoffii]